MGRVEKGSEGIEGRKMDAGGRLVIDILSMASRGREVLKVGGRCAVEKILWMGRFMLGLEKSTENCVANA